MGSGSWRSELTASSLSRGREVLVLHYHFEQIETPWSAVRIFPFLTLSLLFFLWFQTIQKLHRQMLNPAEEFYSTEFY